MSLHIRALSRLAVHGSKDILAPSIPFHKKAEVHRTSDRQGSDEDLISLEALVDASCLGQTGLHVAPDIAGSAP